MDQQETDAEEEAVGYADAESDSEIDDSKEKIQEQPVAVPRFWKALFCGVLISLLGAWLWCSIDIITGKQYPLLAIAMGICLGSAIRFIGDGHTLRFRILGCVLALLTCIWGVAWSVGLSVADEKGYNSVLAVFIMILHPAVLVELTEEITSPEYGLKGALVVSMIFAFMLSAKSANKQPRQD